KNRRLLWLLPLLLICVLIAYVIRCYSVPDGTYVDTLTGTIGPTYWVFSDGRVTLETIEDRTSLGIYSKLDGKWAYRHDSQSPPNGSLKPTILGITVCLSTNTNTTLFIPRRGFSLFSREKWYDVPQSP